MLRVKVADMDTVYDLFLQLTVVNYLQELVAYDKRAEVITAGSEAICGETENYLLDWQGETLSKLEKVLESILLEK